MASCQDVINNDLNSNNDKKWNIIDPYTPVHFVGGGEIKNLISLKTTQQQTVVFIITLVNVTGYNYQINLFKLERNNNNRLISIGSFTNKNKTSSFQVDLAVGEYVICISSVMPIEGDLQITFSNFKLEIRLFPLFYVGEHAFAALTTFPQPPRERGLRRKFYLISGSIPPGMTFGEDGVISGIVPNLDEITEPEYAPSINWFFNTETEEWEPISRQWKFRAKVQLVDYPYAYDEADFIIEIFNNWSFDKDAFLRDKGFFKVTETYTYVDIDNPLNTDLCCPKENDEFQKPAIQPLPKIGVSNNEEINPVQVVIDEFKDTNNPEIKQFIEKLKRTDKYIKKDNVETFIETQIEETRLPDHIDYIVMNINNEEKANNMPLLFLGYFGDVIDVELKTTI